MATKTPKSADNNAPVTRKYILTKGAHAYSDPINRTLTIVNAGDTIHLTDEQTRSESFRGRLRPFTDTAASEDVPIGFDTSDPVEEDETEEIDWHETMNNLDTNAVLGLISELTSLSDLEKARAEETGNLNRTKVVRAIDTRLTEIPIG